MSEHAYTARAISRGAGVSYRRAGPGRRPPIGLGGSLGVAALCLVGLAATWSVSALVPRARLKDAVALRDFTLLSRPHVDAVAHTLLSMLEPLPFTLLAIALVVIAVRRGQARLAVAVAMVMALAPLSAELLKPLLAHTHDHLAGTYISAASWPSGHATAATVLALCAVLVSPRHLRAAIAAIGVVFVLAVGCSLLILAWHMPSDVIGGYLLGTLWVALALAALRAGERGRSRQVRPASVDAR